jgi:hypothetical protein
MQHWASPQSVPEPQHSTPVALLVEEIVCYQMIEHRSTLSPAAARLLASISRQIADRLPVAAASDISEPDPATLSTDGVEAACQKSHAVCSVSVLDAPVSANASSTGPGAATSEWLWRRDVSTEIAVSPATLRALDIGSGDLVKASHAEWSLCYSPC